MNILRKKSALVVFIEYYLASCDENNFNEFIEMMSDYPLNNELNHVKFQSIKKKDEYGEDYFNAALSSRCPEEIAHFIEKET